MIKKILGCALFAFILFFLASCNQDYNDNMTAKLTVGDNYNIIIVDEEENTQKLNCVILELNDKRHPIKVAYDEDIYVLNLSLNIWEKIEIDLTTINFEQITDEELEYVFKYHNKYPTNMGYINGKYYGRIVSSSSSIDNAIEVVTNHFTDYRYPFSTNSVVEVRLDTETELFYGVYVKWEHNASGQLSYYDEYVISFKEEIIENKVKKLITDNEYAIFKTKEPELIKQIMDYRYYNSSHDILGSKLLYSEVVENDDAFVYKSYGTMLIGGDFGLQDEISLIKTIYKINKSTGELILSSSETIKTIFVDGECTHLG